MIELRQIRYFIAVAEDLHYARAADRLNLAPSALSAQIRRLEETLGVRLFDRNKRAAVRLTPPGEMFLVEARSALRQMERAEQVGRRAARGEAGRVALGYIGSAVTSGLLSRLLARFRRSHPDVRVEIMAMETPRQLSALGDGLIDVGLIRPRTAYAPELSARPIHRERLVLALPQDHPLGQQPVIRSSDLSREAFIAPQFNEADGFLQILIRLGQAGGFALEPVHRVNDFTAAASLAAAGYGVVLAPGSLEGAHRGLLFRPIEDFEEEVEIALACRGRERSPAVRAFIEMAHAVAAQPVTPQGAD